MSKLNIPFTVFVSPKLVIERNEYLSIINLRIIKIEHLYYWSTWLFPDEPLTNLSLDNIKNEIYNSKQWLGYYWKKCFLHVYPHGAVNNFIKNEVKNVGFISASSNKAGVNTLNSDLFELRRTPILSHDYMNQFYFED